MSIIRRGDTLIEVLFAFAILSAIIAVSFSGAMNSYKSALSAQNQTQASFVAQYQADALKTYRDSLEWNDTTAYSFLTGNSPSLPAMSSYIGSSSFCMEHQASTNSWGVIEITAITTCDDLLRTTLAPQLGSSAKLAITLTAVDPADFTKGVYASIQVTWHPRNSNTTQNVTNTILLTKDR